MSTFLNDGSVLPSNYSAISSKKASNFRYNNTLLHVGMVTQIIYPDDDRSVSKTVIEYDVAVTNMDVSNGLNLSIFRNCKLSDRFGAPQDYEEFTLRVAVTDEQNGYKDGAIVILECIGGISDAGSAIIIGGVSNLTEPRHKKADGHFYEFQFQGISQKIDKDGAWSITFNSPMDAKLAKSNEAAAGTELKIDKDGVFTIKDNESQEIKVDRVAGTISWGNGESSVVIDKKGKSITLDSAGEWTAKSAKDMTLDAGGKGSLKTKEDCEINSSANLKVEGKSGIKIKSGANVEAKAGAELKLEAGAMATVKAASMVMIDAPKVAVGTGAALPAGIVGVSKSIGITNLPGLPTVSIMCSGSMSVMLGA